MLFGAFRAEPYSPSSHSLADVRPLLLCFSPYGQYVVVELVPALLLLIVMFPVAIRKTRPKFASASAPLLPNNIEALVVRGDTRATTYGIALSAANDPNCRV